MIEIPGDHAQSGDKLHTLKLITCPPANQIARNVSPAGALNRLMHTLYRLMHTLSSTRTRRPREEL